MNPHYTFPDLGESSLAPLVFEKVFRTDFQQSGFALLEFTGGSSRELRELMLHLKSELDQLLSDRDDKKLNFEWLGRFDQQETTPFHRDNAGDSSFLMLGYEPTEVESRLLFADYTKFISDRKLTESEFFENYNPMFTDIEEELTDFVTELDFGDRSSWKIALINNSAPGQPLPGVMHKAIVSEPDLSKRRVINSVMMNVVPMNEPESYGIEAQRHFSQTSEISGISEA